MRLKDIRDEDFLQYKKPAMFIICPYCSFKCDKENGTQACQNWALTKELTKDIANELIVDRYVNNPISKSIVFGGLEPLDSFDELLDLIDLFRKKTDDDIVIYTGYTEEEAKEQVSKLATYKNIIMKFGRYRLNQKEHYDDVLGITLASDNQHGKKIS